MRRVLGPLLALGVVLGAVGVFRATAMTFHERIPAGSRLEVRATASWRGHPARAIELSRGLAIMCAAEASARARVRSFVWHDEGEFEFVVVPAFDAPDRRQFRGCLTDLQLPLLRVAVDAMHTEMATDDDE